MLALSAFALTAAGDAQVKSRVQGHLTGAWEIGGQGYLVSAVLLLPLCLPPHSQKGHLVGFPS